MTLNRIVEQNFTEHLEVARLVRETLAAPIAFVGQVCADSLAKGGTLFWCGNGGSAADSQHLAAEFVGRFKKNRKPLRALALTTDTSGLTCIANDFSYDDVFARQIEAFGRPGDVLIAISTSGNSENVLRALRSAKAAGVVTVALLGKGGGPARDLADHALVVPSATTARVQETHILLGHIICELVEQELGFA